MRKSNAEKYRDLNFTDDQIAFIMHMKECEMKARINRNNCQTRARQFELDRQSWAQKIAEFEKRPALTLPMGMNNAQDICPLRTVGKTVRSA